MYQIHAVVLIIVSFAAFIMSLYCVLFMVPVKRFWERIHSLGGGMKGIESHVEGVRDEIKVRLTELEQSTRQQLAESRQAASGVLDRLAKEGQELRHELDRLRKDVQSLQAGLRSTGSDAMRVGQTCESLTKELQQLRSDFDGLDVELRESVRQLVSDCFSTVESTVLSALDAIQEEILYGVSGVRPTKPLRPRQGPERPPSGAGVGLEGRGRGNIISVGPLFADLRSEHREEGDEQPSGPAEGGPESAGPRQEAAEGEGPGGDERGA